MNFPEFLRVVVMTKSIQFKLNATHTAEEKYFDRTDLEMASMLAHVFKFSYTLMSPEDGQLGAELPDGNWTGMVGMVLRNQADIVVSILSVTEQRSKVLDFSLPFHRARITFIGRKPEYSPDMSSLQKPFSTQVWILVMACIIIMPILFCLLSKGRISYNKIIWAIYRSLLMQPFEIRPNNVRECFLIVGWTIPVIFLGFGYTCVLLSYITVPTLTGIRTIPELAVAVNAGTHQCVTYPGTFIGGALATSKDPNSRVIGKSLLRTASSADIASVLSVSSPRKQAFVGGADHFVQLRSKYFVSDDEFLPALPSFAVRKNFCCVAELSRFVGHVWSSGIYQKLVSEDGFLSTIKILLHVSDEEDEEKVKQFTFTDFVGAFLVLGFGHALGLLALLYELAIKYMENRDLFSNKYLSKRFFIRKSDFSARK